MSDRIYAGSPHLNVDAQYNEDTDPRYIGVIKPKRRLHPRLLIRKFRSTNLGITPLQATPIIEYNNFILTDAMESVEEKFQVVRTFGPDFLFLFGPAPRVFTYSGILYNTQDKPWKDSWQRAWDRQIPNQAAAPANNSVPDSQRGILSGTTVLTHGGIARLEYDGSSSTSGPGGILLPEDNPNTLVVREGYIIKFEIRSSSRTQNMSQFSLSMFITNTLNF
jgi:hypothetical protein